MLSQRVDVLKLFLLFFEQLFAWNFSIILNSPHFQEIELAEKSLAAERQELEQVWNRLHIDFTVFF